MTDAKWVVLAHLVRPQGRNGELLAEILTDFPERFADRKRLFLARPDSRPASAEAETPREVILQNHWLHKGRIVLKFATVDSINDAEALRGLDVVIPREERAPLEEGAVYIDDLIGCRVFDVRGTGEDPSLGGAFEEIGEIVDVDRGSGAGDLLVVKTNSGEEVLIPFVKAYLKRVDLAEKRIEMELPVGLVGLNAPLSAEEKAAAKASSSS
jgi:16S rRNA processing protein RimM